MSCEYIEKKVKLCFQIILHRFLVFTMKRPYCKPKKVPQNIFQQGYLAAYASRVNCEMLWYPNRVGEPKYCSGVSQIIRLPQNLLQKFKKTVMVIFPCQGVMSYVTQPRLLGNETEKQWAILRTPGTLAMCRRKSDLFLVDSRYTRSNQHPCPAAFLLTVLKLLHRALHLTLIECKSMQEC